MQLSEFDFILPAELIAQTPAERRGQSRLLVAGGHGLSDHVFDELPNYLEEGDLLVLNDTKVIRARLHGIKETGGRIEVLVERILDDNRVLASIRASKSPKSGSKLFFADDCAEVLGREGEFYLLRFSIAVQDMLDEHGKLPLPPYIAHQADEFDEERYQTVYAKHPGAVAAPTAGLHFDEAMLGKLKEKGVGIAHVTLHVGAGTFQPVRVENILDHKMHSEHYLVPEATEDAIRNAKEKGRKVIAVGTTALRALESFALYGKREGETTIYITPGFEFRMVDRLLTNFHLPKSTLLMLVSAFAGMDEIRNAYRHAIDKHYRFFSYGDAMLLERKK
jgi:S-adenosylmethionine:tRNA ribosyltransferase-isomerase